MPFTSEVNLLPTCIYPNKKYQEWSELPSNPTLDSMSSMKDMYTSLPEWIFIAQTLSIETLYSFDLLRGSFSVQTWDRLISCTWQQPDNFRATSNSSWSIFKTFLTPASPSTANPYTTGLPTCTSGKSVSAKRWRRSSDCPKEVSLFFPPLSQ